MLTRRAFATLTASFASSLASTASPRAACAKGGAFEITKTEEDWRKILTREQFYVLRQHGTEHPGSSPLDKLYAAGKYHCAACDLEVFSSAAKFDSGTGWPSFWQPLENAVGKSVDNTLFTSRTEIHCRRCGGHFGHVFPDGPPPTGQRYCMNGVALKFVPEAAG